MCRELGGVGLSCVKRDQAGQVILKYAAFHPCSTAEECQRVLEQQVKQENLQNSPCVSVLPADTYQLMQVDVDKLPEAERRDAVRWQINERLDYPAEDAVIDVFETPPFSGDKRPTVYAVSAQQKILRERLKMVKEVDLAIESINIPEFALRNICDLFTEDDRGVAILLLLEQSGVLVIERDEILYLVRWLNIGMDDLLSIADGDDESLAEQLDAIVLEVQRSFDYCESNFHLPMVSRLLVAQTQREIPAVVSYLNDILITQVEPLSFENILVLPEGSEQTQLNRCLFTIGGALRQENN